MIQARADLARNTLGVLFIGGLMAGSLFVLLPFLAALIWATMVVVATWPVLLAAQRRLGGRGRAVALLTIAMALLFILPFALGIAAVAGSADDVMAWVRHLAAHGIGPPPSWLHRLPLAGERAIDAWREVQSRGVPALRSGIEPYAQDLARWLLGELSSLGLLFVQLLLIVILSAVLYAGGEKWARWMRDFGYRLAAGRGEHAIVLAGQAIRSVALGVVVTAIVQTTLGGIGLAVAGVPYPAVLTVLMFVLCIAQIGPLLVLLGGTAWLFSNDQTGWGTFMLVWSLVVGLLDNVLRPILIKRGADLPLLLIFAGVIGGLLAFGVVGIFVGPVILAVSYTLVDNWVHTPDEAVTGTPAATADPPGPAVRAGDP